MIYLNLSNIICDKYVVPFVVYLSIREICLPMHSFDDFNKFKSTLNEEIGGGDFICGGMVKTKDIKDYIVWLKDSYHQSGEMRKLLPAQHVGFIKNASIGFSAIK